MNVRARALPQAMHLRILRPDVLLFRSSARKFFVDPQRIGQHHPGHVSVAHPDACFQKPNILNAVLLSE